MVLLNRIDIVIVINLIVVVTAAAAVIVMTQLEIRCNLYNNYM